MYNTFKVSSSGCISCNNEVLKELGTLQGVFGAEIDRLEGLITVSHTDEVTRKKIAETLNKLGLPEIENDDFSNTDCKQ
jgi:copper chaperone CopZ